MTQEDRMEHDRVDAKNALEVSKVESSESPNGIVSFA